MASDMVSWIKRINQDLGLRYKCKGRVRALDVPSVLQCQAQCSLAAPSSTQAAPCGPPQRRIHSPLGPSSLRSCPDSLTPSASALLPSRSIITDLCLRPSFLMVCDMGIFPVKYSFMLIKRLSLCTPIQLHVFPVFFFLHQNNLSCFERHNSEMNPR